jgi:hypothetical protein
VRVAFALDAADAGPEIPTIITIALDPALAAVVRRPGAARLRLLVRDRVEGWAIPVDADETPVGRVGCLPLGDGRFGISAVLVRRAELPAAKVDDAARDAIARILALALTREVQ